jgi:hypothetical protein
MFLAILAALLRARNDRRSKQKGKERCSSIGPSPHRVRDQFARRRLRVLLVAEAFYASQRAVRLHLAPRRRAP